MQQIAPQQLDFILDPFKIHFESVITEEAAAQLKETKPGRRQILVMSLTFFYN